MTEQHIYSYQVNINGTLMKDLITADNPQDAIEKVVKSFNRTLVSIKPSNKTCFNAATSLVKKDGKPADKSQRFYMIETQSINDKKDTSDFEYTKLAKAFIVIDKEQLGMGDSFREVVDSLAFEAKYDIDTCDIDEYRDLPEFKDCVDDDEILDKLACNAYIKLIKENPSVLENIIKSWDKYDVYETLEYRMAQFEHAKTIDQSTIYKSLCLIYKFAKNTKMSNEAIKPLYKFISKFKTKNLNAINLGNSVGRKYYSFLDSKIFGTITNDYFTVGHKITTSDKQEHKEYKGYDYVFHKDFNVLNKPEVSLCALFKNIDENTIDITIKLGRYGYTSPHTVAVIGYIKDIQSIKVPSDIDCELCAKNIANLFNDLGKKIYNLAKQNPELYKLLPQGAPLQQY